MERLKKIAICIRVYPDVSKNPAVYKSNKKKIFALSCYSLSNALSEIDYFLIFILDGCDFEYKEIINRHFSIKKSKLIFLKNRKGGKYTFLLQKKILLKQNFSKLIMFAEDDYVYTKNSIKKALKFIEYNDDIFITLADDSDYYNKAFHQYPKEVININDQIWIRRSTTTFSFLTTQDSLKKTLKNFLTYQYDNFDSSIWLSITKYYLFRNIFNPFVFFKDRNYIRFLKLIYFTNFHLLFHKKFKLYSPYPSLASHLETENIPSSFDLQTLVDDFEKN